MYRIVAALLLQFYALLLAVLRMGGGLATDEAKYLLNIPYPHPPLARWLLSLTETFPYQEFLWRFLFATLLVQAVWVVAGLGDALSLRKQATLWSLWLLSSGVILAGGTLFMAPLSALQGLFFAWLYFQKQERFHAATIALVWLLSLFTAYQAVLYAPLLFAVYVRRKLPLWKIVFYMGAPVVLLALYTLSNPLTIAVIVNEGGSDTRSVVELLGSAAKIFLLGGGVIFCTAGIIGIIVERRGWALLTLFAVFLYAFLSPHTYNAILFTPVLVIGALSPLVLRWPRILLCGMVLTGAITLPRIATEKSVRAEEVLRSVPVSADHPLVIHGSFGHEWQYFAGAPVLRFTQASLERAETVVCLEECPELASPAWEEIRQSPSVWVRSVPANQTP